MYKMVVTLSKRLAAVASFVPKGSPVADIGTDHALIPVHLVSSNKSPHAIAGDIHAGPVQAAERQVRQARLEDKIEVRKGDGLAVLQPGEAETVIIAGMGGGTIVDILSSVDVGSLGIRRLILQPNIGERLVRVWLRSNGWLLRDETLLEEDGLSYEIIMAESGTPEEAAAYDEWLYSRPLPGVGRPSSDIRLLMGPLLLSSPTSLFVAKWTEYARKLGRIISEVGKSDQPEAAAKRDQLLVEKEQLEEVLSCLSR